MKPTATALPVPLQADSVESPIVSWGSGPSCINFLLNDEESWGRVTFEKLDSIRVSRGEYAPCEVPGTPGQPVPWVATVADSPWLKERYEYERQHYGSAYEFDGDVDEMLRDFRHFVFSFHDEFVEAIAAGIWFESSRNRIGNAEPDSSHPLSDLPESTVSERFTAHGITCQVRLSPRPVEQLVADALYCSQKLFQFAAELDGSASVSWTLQIRRRDQRTIAQLCGYFRNIAMEFDHVPTLAEVRPPIERWLAEVSARRQAMGR